MANFLARCDQDNQRSPISCSIRSLNDSSSSIKSNQFCDQNISNSPMTIPNKCFEQMQDVSSPIFVDFKDCTPQSTPSKRLYNDLTPGDVQIVQQTIPSSVEKRQREIEESERLAWQLMEEESINAYEMQVKYMRDHPELFDEADLSAVGAALQENVLSPSQNRNAQEDSNYQDDSENGDTEDENSADWTYEQLLELGRTIGDVKTERWKMRSANVISRLTKLSFKLYKEQKIELGIMVEGDATCSVCMECHEDDSEVIELPCGHFFHALCSEEWLKENNSCPLCKKKITSSP